MLDVSLKDTKKKKKTHVIPPIAEWILIHVSREKGNPNKTEYRIHWVHSWRVCADKTLSHYC